MIQLIKFILLDNQCPENVSIAANDTCICLQNNRTYDPDTNQCICDKNHPYHREPDLCTQCNYTMKEESRTCVCEEQDAYIYTDYCIYCGPQKYLKGSVCVCKNINQIVNEDNQCQDCPKNSYVYTYQLCKCDKSNYDYNKDENKCYKTNLSSGEIAGISISVIIVVIGIIVGIFISLHIKKVNKQKKMQQLREDQKVTVYL